MSNVIEKGHAVRLKIKAGIDKACDAVRPTLGVVGMTALIEYPGLDPIECDDGVTILRNINLKDRYENMGVQMLRKAAIRTSSEGGDGTATTTVITQALVAEAFKEIANDSSRIRDVRERLNKGLVETLDELGKIKREVTEDDIEKIATISSLDPEVAKLIAEVIKEVGVNGVITVEKASKLGYSKDVVKGARFDKGYVSDYFINDQETKSAVIENPFIVIVDRPINTAEHVKSLMDSIQATGNKNVLFIADDVTGIALASLIQNNSTVTIIDNKGTPKTGTFNIACVRNPYTASRAKDFLLDIAALTGGTMISEQAGMKLDTATVDLCGKADKVIVTRDTTTIIGGQPSDALQARIKGIEAELESTTSEYSKAILEERLACLTGGIGVIRVGAYTDSEYNAKKYKFDNAINATQAALQEGIVAGGGVALVTVSLSISELMFKEALIAPIKQMAINAGMAWYEVVSEAKSKINGGTIGYNFRTKEVANMFDAGIIDPFKVTRLALESATAIASSLVAIETGIVNEDEDKKDK